MKNGSGGGSSGLGFLCFIVLARWRASDVSALWVLFFGAALQCFIKRGYPFSLMLYFKADTPDLAQFDTPQKMERSVRVSSEKYLPGIVEKTITIQKVPVFTTYGFYTVLTDADVVKKANPGPREFKYLTRGMVRLSKNSALGFSIMSNDVDSANYRKLLDYVYSFIKPGAKS